MLLDDFETCAVADVILAGRLAEEQITAPDSMPAPVGLNSVKRDPVTAETFRVPASGPSGPVIGLIPDSIVTEHLTMALPFQAGERLADPANDVLKVCVLARHGVNANVGRGFVKGFGFKAGALASSVGHDSHNLCVVGASDEDMAIAVNRLIELQGGFVAVRDGRVLAELPLPVAGLMSTLAFEDVRDRLKDLRAATQAMGCRLKEPFLHLAFLPLPVIPHLKITDHGMIDVDTFKLIAA